MRTGLGTEKLLQELKILRLLTKDRNSGERETDRLLIRDAFNSYLNTCRRMGLEPLEHISKTVLERLHFDEFKNREYADWKRVRAAIEHENTLVNHRLTWLLTSQGFLFAGFGVVYSKTSLDLYSMMILLVIAIVGMAISFKIFVDIESAAEQLSELDKWWHMRYAPEEYESHIHRDEITIRREAYEKKLKTRHPALQSAKRTEDILA